MYLVGQAGIAVAEDGAGELVGGGGGRVDGESAAEGGGPGSGGRATEANINRSWHGFYVAAALFGGGFYVAAALFGGGFYVAAALFGGEVDGGGGGRGGEHAAEVERTAEERGHHGWGGEVRGEDMGGG
uniref:Uncharacterized protein n=1 Tax=Oryza sativa subsp. japonica TaxID=39947 RepID=Q67V96_ORYSJ|nr:hypothetical protein [Oryza sativa Japonica Group]BAD37923.1 hypothetical protein [Oryza sativa Japonica Group]